MLKLEYDKQEILDVIDRIVKRTMRLDLTWDWPCGVAYYGIADAYEKTGNETYLKLLKDRVDELIEVGLPKMWTVNTCAMGHCLITMYKATGEQKYWDIVMSKIYYIRNEALRFGEHVLQHTVSANNDFPEQCWADTLFMAALFLLRVGVELADEEMIEDALNQYYWHIKYLQNSDTGMYYHGYNNITKDHMSGIYWGRANAWAAFTMSQVEDLLPKCYLYPKYMDVASSLNEQLSALKLVQTENGLWRTILDNEHSYEEISASAGIAAAMVSRANPLHTKYINKSIKGLLANVSSDGRVLNVSGGTAVMNDADGYLNISRDWIQGWGQGLALVFFDRILVSDKKEKVGALSGVLAAGAGTGQINAGLNVSVKDWSFLQYWLYAAFPSCFFLQRYLSQYLPECLPHMHENWEKQASIPTVYTVMVAGQEIAIWMYRHHVEYRVGDQELYLPCLAYDVVKALKPNMYLLLLPIVDMATCDYRSEYVLPDLTRILSETAIPKEHIEEVAYGICMGLIDGDGAEDTPLWIIWQETEDARYGAAWWPDAEELDFLVEGCIKKYITAPQGKDIYLWAREMLSQWVLEIKG